MTDAARETGASARVTVDWFNFCRDVCAQNFLDHPIVIGGPGTVVEIDESKFGKRKHNRGRAVDGHWVLEESSVTQPNHSWLLLRIGALQPRSQ